MNFPNREIVERVRREYPAGTRVELVRMDDVLFGKLSAPTFFTLNAPVFQMVWINIQNFCICLRSLFKVSIV